MTISVEDAVIAKITKNGVKFEVLVDPRKALEVRAGKEIPLDDLVVSEELYEDVKKGMRVADDKINTAFGTNNMKEIIYKIIKQGDVQLTTNQRKEFMEKKVKAIATIISSQGVNPQTKLPHPVDRVLRAMEQVKAKIVLEKSPEEQIESVVESIQSVIPISFEKVKLSIKIPAQFAGKSSSVIRNFGKILKEEWKADGSYFCVIEVPGGIQQDIFDKLNSLTHGQFDAKKD